MYARWTAWLALVVAVLGVQAFAVPVKPDLEKILKEQQQRPRHYEPARAGWNGPEMVRPQESSPNPVYEAYGPASTARAIRASLRAAATPDPVALLGIGMLILLLRVVRSQGQRKAAVVAIGPQAKMVSQERKAA
jgi:hypothetical protein